jgi:MFS family permease
MANETPTETPGSDVTLTQVFSNRNFTLLWLGQVVAYLGDNFFKMAAVAMVTFGLTNQADKGAMQNWVTTLGNVPYLIFPLLLAPLIDRSDRKMLLVWMDVYRAVLIIFAAFIITSESPRYLAFILVFLVYAGSSVFFPAKSLFMTEIVPPSHLLRANSVSTTVGSLMALFGTFIGTRLVEWFGYSTTLFITVGTYLFSMVTLLAISKVRAGISIDEAKAQELAKLQSHSSNMFKDVQEGWRVTRTNPVALGSVLVFGWIWGVVGGFFALLTALIYEVLGKLLNRTGNEDLLNLQGEVLGLVGISMFVGGVIVGRLASHFSLRRVLACSFLGAAMTIGLLAVPYVQTKPFLMLALFFILGSFGGSIMIPVETAIGKGVPREVRGRVFAFNTVFHVALLVGMLTLTTLYLQWMRDYSLKLEIGFGVIAAMSLIGVGLTAILPSKVMLATLQPGSFPGRTTK